ncbi:MAG: hypothetical protein ACLQNE_23365 [Thermoguttaceae bacterium]
MACHRFGLAKSRNLRKLVTEMSGLFGNVPHSRFGVRWLAAALAWPRAVTCENRSLRCPACPARPKALATFLPGCREYRQRDVPLRAAEEILAEMTGAEERAGK